MTHAQQKRLIEFALKHKFIITPMGWKNHLAQYDKLGHCPCEVTRPECPCPEAVTEVPEKGHCSCSLFYASYKRYMEICFERSDK
jgi:hypothetical protein